jgi:hypothetical protein
LDDSQQTSYEILESMEIMDGGHLSVNEQKASQNSSINKNVFSYSYGL